PARIAVSFLSLIAGPSSEVVLKISLGRPAGPGPKVPTTASLRTGTSAESRLLNCSERVNRAASGSARRRGRFDVDLRGDQSGSRATFLRVAHDAIGVGWVESWPGGQKGLAQPGCPRRRYCVTRDVKRASRIWPLGFPHVLQALLHQIWWPRPNPDRSAPGGTETDPRSPSDPGL